MVLRHSHNAWLFMSESGIYIPESESPETAAQCGAGILNGSLGKATVTPYSLEDGGIMYKGAMSCGENVGRCHTQGPYSVR